LREQLLRFQGRPVSSVRHLEQRLRAWFDHSAGFRLEQSSVERVWQATPKGDAPFAYIGSLVGEQRRLPALPDVRLCPEATAEALEMLRELGVFVFVASRI
jgi:hypothetical protein